VELTELGRGGPQVSRVGLGLMGRGADIIPLIGTKRRDRLALGALSLDLGAGRAEVARDRYDPASMAALDSEKP
jgi:hypothetical protein